MSINDKIIVKDFCSSRGKINNLIHLSLEVKNLFIELALIKLTQEPKNKLSLLVLNTLKRTNIFKIMNNFKDFLNIKKSELELFNQLTIKQIYLIDENGDIAYDKNNQPIVIGENKGNVFKLSKSNIFQELNGKSTLIDGNVYDGYADVFQLDDFLYETGAKLLVYYKNDIYQGCTWFFENDKYVGMYGIRTSISNFLRNIKGTATEIINEIKKIANKRTVLVPWPLEGMIPLLKKMGFIEINTNKMNSQRKFLSKFTGTTNYWELIYNNT